MLKKLFVILTVFILFNSCEDSSVKDHFAGENYTNNGVVDEDEIQRVLQVINSKLTWGLPGRFLMITQFII
jgi:hypothetical protein